MEKLWSILSGAGAETAAGLRAVHVQIENRLDTPSRTASAVDERTLCFEADPTANFLINSDGTVRYANTAGRAMLFDGLLQFDAHQRLSVARSGGRGAPPTPLQPIAHAFVRQIARSQWLAVTVRPVPSAPGILHVRACQVRLDGEIDLRLVIGELGISESEAPVLEGLAQAVCPKQISRALNLSVHTVRSHIRSIYAKLGVHTAAEAQLRVLQIHYALRALN